MELREREEASGLRELETYTSFGERVRALKLELLEFLLQAQAARGRPSPATARPPRA